MLQFDDERQNKHLKDLRHLEEEHFIELSASTKNLPYANLSNIAVNLEALRYIPETEARMGNIVAFDIQNKHLSIGLLPDQNDHTKNTLDRLTKDGFSFSVVAVSKTSLEHIYESYKDLSYAVEAKAGSIEISNEKINELLSVIKKTKDVAERIKQILDEKKAYKISRVIEVILAGALVTTASDIHIEPGAGGAVVRYRLDGVLNIILQFDTETYALIINRLKLLSGLKINVRNVPQDGRFSVAIKNEGIDVRVSTLPGTYGESVVMRILNAKSILVSIEDIGIEPVLRNILEREINKPNGMILTTGPTGSGKTTTLYAFLRKIYSPELKIITIENPVEYHLPGIVQSQVDTERGFTFIHGLRAAVRQDPDVIMVGEIRDEETARTAIDAALTGHLVFSTLHTNNAAGAFTRLIDLSVNPKVITSAVTVAIAQRLGRKLCTACKKEKKPSLEEKLLLEKILSSIKGRKHPSSVNTLWTAPGCEACNNTGFKGRIGIYEAILSNEKIESVVINNPSEREIRKLADDQGILTLRQDGVLKILEGITSIEEVNRVIDLSTEE